MSSEYSNMPSEDVFSLLEPTAGPEDESGKLQEKAQKTKRLLEDKGFPDNYDSLVISFDWNSPIATTADSREIHQNVEEMFSEMDLSQNFCITSGHPLRNLREFRDMIDQPDMRLIGESGAVYLNQSGQVEELRPDVSKEELYQLHQQVFEEAAREEKKILIQPDQSSVKGCIRVEGEGRIGDERGGTYNIGETNLTTEDIYNELLEMGGGEEFVYEDEGVIRFENSLENAASITEVARNSFHYPGIRFEEAGEDLVLYVDEDDPEIEKQEALDFLVSSLPEGWEYSRNDAWGVDFKREDVYFSKQDGLVSAYAHYQNPFFAHAGDRESDVLDLDNGISFPIQNSEAHQYAEEESDPANEVVAVKDAEEYLDVLNKTARLINS